MDEPLFGEKRKTKTLVYIVGAVISLFIIACVIVGVIYGVKRSPVLFLLVGTTICGYITLTILVKWYNNGDLDGKFKILIFLLLATVLLIANSLIINSAKWPGKCVQQEPCSSGQLYSIDYKTCYNLCSGDQCLQIINGTANCIDCTPVPSTTGATPPSFF